MAEESEHVKMMLDSLHTDAVTPVADQLFDKVSKALTYDLPLDLAPSVIRQEADLVPSPRAKAMQ